MSTTARWLCSAAVLLALAACCPWGIAQEELAVLESPAAKQLFEPLTKSAPSGNAGLFVGVNQFNKDGSLNDLDFAVHDAIELAHAFVFELKLVPAKNCRLLLSGSPKNGKASKPIRDHLARLRRAGATVGSADRTEILVSFLNLQKAASKESDVFVCSFCSHGFEDRGQAYIMPSDGVKQLLRTTAIPLQDIEASMEDSKAGHRLLLVDACQERISVRSSQSAASRTTDAFVRALRQPTGQGKFASCSPGQMSHELRDSGGIGHGLFTHGFLRAVRGGAKPDESGIVRLGAVAEYVATYTADWSRNNAREEQHPFLEGPVSLRQLPLAVKADDLTTLLTAFQAQTTNGVVEKQVKAQLVSYLQESPLADPRDMQLINYIRRYVNGEITDGLIAAYIDNDRSRWGAATRRAARPGLLRVPFSPRDARAKREQWASHLDVDEKITNTVGMSMKLVPPGSFTMGGYERPNEKAHQVTISKPFYVSEHELTVGQFREFVKATGYRTEQQRGNWPVRGWDSNRRRFTQSSSFSWENPGWSQRDDHPVVHVSWNDGQRFVSWLNQKEGETYRFLTEAEWEYCCRAGTTTLYSVGNDQNQLVKVGNVLDKSGMQTFSSDSQFRQQNQHIMIYRSDGTVFTSPVGNYQPNGLGLYDFHGNICEWCHDWFTDSYESLDSKDPQGANFGSSRVARGGRFDTGGGLSRSFRRNQGTPTTTDMILGVRLARNLSVDE